MQYEPIRARVSPETITKVTRLFNGSLADIINELFQNARRANASSVSVTAASEGDRLRVSVSDNGSGIDDPARIVALGASGWSEDVVAFEDPAGMGVFSLAGKDAMIISRHASQKAAWRAIIPADAWTGERDIAVEKYHRAIGTTISFLVDGTHEGSVDHAVTVAAKHFPLKVTFNGSEKPRQDFLAGAKHRLEWNGSTIGIFEGRPYHHTPTVNFHGVTICENLFAIDDTKRQSFHARLDIGSTPALQLVLPARKEFVENDALIDLRQACERAIYTHIASLDDHHLSFESWSRARELGIDLPEAKAELEAWEPDTADSDNGHFYGDTLAIDGEQLLCHSYEAHFDQAIARALSAQPLRQKLVAAKPAYEGYSWYDALRVLDDARFTATIGDVQYAINGVSSKPSIAETIEAARIELSYRICAQGTKDGECEAVLTDFVTLFPDGCCSDGLEDVTIVYVRSERLDAESFVDLLEASCFSAWNDSDADSWDTQHDRFLRDAREMAHLILEGEDAAIASQFRDAVARIAWTLPKGKAVAIHLQNGSAIEVDVRTIDSAEGTNGEDHR